MGKLFFKVPRTEPLKIRESRRRPAQLTFDDLGRWMRNFFNSGMDYIYVGTVQNLIRRASPERAELIANYIRTKYKGGDNPKQEEDESFEEMANISRPRTSSATLAAARNRNLAEDEIQVVPEETVKEKKGKNYSRFPAKTGNYDNSDKAVKFDTTPKPSISARPSTSVKPGFSPKSCISNKQGTSPKPFPKRVIYDKPVVFDKPGTSALTGISANPGTSAKPDTSTKPGTSAYSGTSGRAGNARIRKNDLSGKEKLLRSKKQTEKKEDMEEKEREKEKSKSRTKNFFLNIFRKFK